MALHLPEKPCDIEKMFGLLSEFFEEAGKESNRGLVLSGSSAIEEMLKSLVWQFALEPSKGHAKFNNELMGRQGILSTFSATSTICFAMGMIDERLYQQIDAIRAVRNHAAHTIGFNFQDEKIQPKLQPYLDKSNEGVRITKLDLQIGSFPGSTKPDAKLVIEDDSLTVEKIAYLFLVQEAGTNLLGCLQKSEVKLVAARAR